MLLKPELANSKDRSILPKKHPELLIADEWFTETALRLFNYKGLQGYDFFINWRTFKLSEEVWVKRIIAPNSKLESTKLDYIQNLIYECDGEETVKLAANFFNGQLKYKIFRESDNWGNHENNPYPILDVRINREGIVE